MYKNNNKNIYGKYQLFIGSVVKTEGMFKLFDFCLYYNIGVIFQT